MRFLFLFLALFCPVAAFSFMEVPMTQSGSRLPEAKIWQVLTKAKVDFIEHEDSYTADIKLPPEVEALEGKKLKVMGYMFPLEETEKHKHFILMVPPPACPFHPHASTEEMIEVFLGKPISFHYKPVTVEGTLTIDRKAEMGVLYFIRDGKIPG